MRRFLVSLMVAGLLTTGAGVAGAGELAEPNWTGFYLSGGAGYGMWTADSTSFDPATGACVLCVPVNQGGKGWLGTIGFGYDARLANNMVVGVFADADLAHLDGVLNTAGFAADAKLDRSWAVGGRLGLMLNPGTLTYFNAGYSQASFRGGEFREQGTGVPAGTFTQSLTAKGWFLGGGSETSFAHGWFWRNEYRYTRFDSADFAQCLDGTSLCGAAGGLINFHFNPTVQTIRSEIVFKFQ